MKISAINQVVNCVSQYAFCLFNVGVANFIAKGNSISGIERPTLNYG
jgi:hypothetical protein